MITVTNDAPARYLAAVEVLLGHLPEAERTEVLDDLEQHLRELDAEPGPTLIERLGAPEAYAAEFVASLGLDAPAPTAAAPSPSERTRALAADLAAHPWVAATRRFLPELRPAWWVARGYLAVVALGAVFLGSSVPFPGLLTAVAVVGAVASVRLGRARAAGTTGVRRDQLLTAVGLVAVLVVGSDLAGRSDGGPSSYVDGYGYGYGSPLVTADGRTLTNLFVYDRQGRLLDDVLVYDQDGRPLEAEVSAWDERTGAELVVAAPVDANGASVLHAYPRRTSVRDPFGAPGGATRPVPPPSVVVPVLSEDASGATVTRDVVEAWNGGPISPWVTAAPGTPRSTVAPPTTAAPTVPTTVPTTVASPTVPTTVAPATTVAPDSPPAPDASPASIDGSAGEAVAPG